MFVFDMMWKRLTLCGQLTLSHDNFARAIFNMLWMLCNIYSFVPLCMHVDVFGQSAIHLYEFNIMDHAKSLGPTMLPLSPSESNVGASKTKYVCTY